MMLSTVLVALVTFSFGTSSAEEQKGKHPEKAACSVCNAKGAPHGPEKIAGYSEYKGETYYFCTKTCKEEFDADPESFVTPVFPRPAPNFTLNRIDGAKDSLGAYAGKVLLVDFWATWCGPCKEMTPELIKIQDEFGGKGVSVVGIAIEDELKKVVAYATQKHVNYPMLFDGKETEIWRNWKVISLPSLYLVSADGQILNQWRGKVDFAVVRAEMEKTLAAQTDLTKVN